MMAIIEADQVSRFYGIVLGLNSVSFAIHPGITGVIGPNGAGKTTLFRLLIGQIKPCSGSLHVFGETPWKNAAIQSRIGYCPEGEAVPANMRPLHWLTALGMVSGLSFQSARERSIAGLDKVRLGREHWKKHLTELSKGMRQRVKLAQCILHKPDLLILDEPMNGLDPMGREDIANVLRDLASSGVAIVISSHILPDLESLCRNFILLKWGRIRRTGNELATHASDDSDHQPQRKQWPGSTAIRCADPEALARFFFERHLARSCAIETDGTTLRIQWSNPMEFYENSHNLLLESGVPIMELRSSGLEQAIDLTPVR